MKENLALVSPYCSGAIEETMNLSLSENSTMLLKKRALPG